MDFPQGLINAALSIAFGVLGWFAREMWAAVKELKADLAKLREELPKSYVIREDYRVDIRELKEMLNRIFEKLDHKQDK